MGNEILTDMPPMLSIKELANYLNIGKSLANKLISNGEIGSVRVGEKLIRVPKEEVIKYLNNNGKR